MRHDLQKSNLSLSMLITKRKPASVGEVLSEEFMEPMHLTQAELAEAIGVPRRLVNELCRNRRGISVQTALILAHVLGTTADFWLNLQKRNDLWEAINSTELKNRLVNARQLSTAV